MHHKRKKPKRQTQCSADYTLKAGNGANRMPPKQLSDEERTDEEMKWEIRAQRTNHRSTEP